MNKKKILSRHSLRRAMNMDETHKLRASYVEAAKLHFQKLWSNTLEKMDPIERHRVIAMVEEWADDFTRQAEKCLADGRAGRKPEGYVPPTRQ